MKKFLRRIAVLLIGLAILILSAAYTTMPVGENELYIKGKAKMKLDSAEGPKIKDYSSLHHMISADDIKAEKAKADAAYQKLLDEQNRQQAERTKWVKELKKKYAGKKLVAFTFDDGPSIYTETLLKGLKKRGAHATFMVLGSCATRYEKTIARMIKDGHQIGNHTWNHPNLATASKSKINKELKDTFTLLRELGYRNQCIVVRPPYGSYDDLVKKEANAPLILWSVDTEDWRNKGNVSKVYNNIMRDARDGSIILLHDIYESSVTAALKAMDTLKKEGYAFVTVDELFAIRGVKMKHGKIYYSAPAGKDAKQ